MATTTTNQARSSAPVAQIHTPENIRGLDERHVDALAGSIALQGVLVPVVVRAAQHGFELVAGFHRLAAARKLGLQEIPVVLRDAEQEDADRAIENITRKALSPYEEARAVKAMLDRGLSEAGAAQALGWPRVRVTARVKILALPDRAQQMLGAGTIALSSVDQLLEIGRVSPPLLDALIEFLADGNEWAAERLAREPGWVIDSAIRHGNGKVFAAHLGRIDSHDIAALRLGKKAEAAYERVIELTRSLDRYAYVEMRFHDSEIDQARAAGLVIELDRSSPIIVDRPLYRELVKAAITRTVSELEARVTAREQERKAARQSQKNDSTPADPAVEGEREHRRRMRELSNQAHGVNLDVGAGLLTGLSTVDPADVTVARFFVYSLLGSDYDDSPYTQQGERIARLAVSGIRLVIDEFRSDVTKTRKDETKGALRIDYGNSREPEAPLRWLWKFMHGAKTAGELYGRALVVIAAEQYASRLVIPQSQRTHPTRWSSHKDLAAKALTKLATPHLPGSLRQLEAAVKRAHEEHDRASRRALAAAQRSSRTDAAENPASAAVDVCEAEAEAGEVEEVDETEQ